MRSHSRLFRTVYAPETVWLTVRAYVLSAAPALEAQCPVSTRRTSRGWLWLPIRRYVLRHPCILVVDQVVEQQRNNSWLVDFGTLKGCVGGPLPMPSASGMPSEASTIIKSSNHVSSILYLRSLQYGCISFKSSLYFPEITKCFYTFVRILRDQWMSINKTRDSCRSSETRITKTCFVKFWLQTWDT